MNKFIIYSSWLINYISHHVHKSFVSETTSSCSQRTRATKKVSNSEIICYWIKENFYLSSFENLKWWRQKRLKWHKNNLSEQSYFGKSFSLSHDEISIYWKWHKLFWYLQNLPGNLCCYKQLNFRILLCLKQSFVKLVLDCT